MRFITLILIMTVGVAACDGTVDERDRERWRENDRNWSEDQLSGGRGFR